jgi:hypothetical protein
MRLPKTEMASDGRDIFIVIDGVRVAKRGRSSTAEASTWVTLVPRLGDSRRCRRTRDNAQGESLRIRILRRESEAKNGHQRAVTSPRL